MGVLDRETATDESVQTGFSTVDNKGRIALAKGVRETLGIEPGSSVAYVALDHAVLLVPQDEYLAKLQRQAADALASAGLTVQDLLDALPQARDKTVAAAYRPEFLEHLQRLWEDAHPEQAHDTSTAEASADWPWTQLKHWLEAALSDLETE